MEKKNLNFKGFTIIELLIIVTIIGILAALGVPSLVEYRKYDRVRGATREVQNLFQLARNRTMATGNWHRVAFDEVSTDADGVQRVQLQESTDGGGTYPPNRVITTIDITNSYNSNVLMDVANNGALGCTFATCNVVFQPNAQPGFTGLIAGGVIRFHKNPPGLGGGAAAPYSLDITISATGLARAL